MSRRNRNNRYNSRNRNKWDDGYDDDYFDEDEQEYEEDESSDDQDEYEDEQYEEDDPDEEEYDEDEEYEEDESEDEEYDEDEEYEEDESDDEEYDEDEEYEEDESDDEDVDEEDEYESDEDDESDEDEDDELESEIDAAAESTAKKSIGNSDLLSKLRGQMRPQMKDESPESNKEVEINVSPLSLFGQPIVQNGKKEDSKTASSVTPQHANAKIVQTVTVSSKPTPGMTGSVQKSGSGRVITAQSQNGASVTSVQPRDLAAEKAEADKKQKEKERLEQERKSKEEKSARILNKFKGKSASTGEKTKAGAAWIWSKISSGAVWVWTGIAAGFLWIVLTPKRAWQTWRIFNRSWWAGIGTGVWNVMKKPFVKQTSVDVQPDGSEAVPSGSEPEPAALASTASAKVKNRKSQKKNVDIWDAEASAAPEADVKTDAFASKEPDSRRRLYFSLGSIGAAAVLFLLVLPSMLNGSKKTDENAVALNEQENASDVSNENVNKPVSDEALPASENGFENNDQGIVSRNETSNGNNFNSSRGGSQTGYSTPGAPSFNGNNYNSPRDGSQTGYSTPGAPSNFNAASYNPRPTRQSPTTPMDIPSPEVTTPEVTDLGLDAPEIPTPEVTTPEVTDLGLDAPDLSAPEVTAPEVTDLGLDDADIPAPEVTTPELTTPDVTDLGLDDSDIPSPEVTTPELPNDDVPVPADVTDVSAPDLSDSELEAPSVDLETPEIPEADEPTLSAEDPFNGAAPDIQYDAAPDASENSDVTNPADVQPDLTSAPDMTPTPDLTSSVETPGEPAEAPTPETDVPDLTMPELPDSQPIESSPIEEPSVPTVPEPTEPDSLETGIATQETEPAAPSEPLLVPEDNSSNDSQIASNSPEESPVAIGTPGPLVSSANTGTKLPETQTQNVVSVNPNAYNNTTVGDIGTSGYNNGYVYNSSGVYTVQPNDSFWTIARKIYGSGEYARALAQYNSSRVSPQSLSVSVQIMTPPPETLEQQYPELCPGRGLTPSPASTAAAAPAGTRVYVVDQEESVMEIARRELGSILYCSQVYALNQEQLSGNVDRVKPGVRLLLPVRK